MKRLLIGLTVLLVHTAAAYAQQSPPPGPPPGQAYPPGYGPPPGYVPPGSYGAPPPAPQGYYNYYPPGPPMPPPRRITDRPFTIGGGIGFGGLQFHDRTGGTPGFAHGGFAYTARLGFGLAPRLLLLWDIEGAVVQRGTSMLSQNANLAALQLFLTDRLFIKAGFGLAQINRDDLLYSSWGGAAMGGVGYELVQGWNWSLDIEATYTGASYTNETWSNWSLVNFALNFF